jgi:magnesium transporter
MLMDTGGNTGSQSATVVIRALALRQIKTSHIMRVLWKELRISAMLGLVIVAIAFGRMVLFRPTDQAMGGLPLPAIAGMVCLALALQVVSSTLIGAILPLAAWRAKLDPAVVASPALTTVVDITGLLIYFGMAKLLLGV